MKTLLVITAVVEASVGLLLLLSPSLVATLLLGVPLEATVALLVGRLAGAALLTLGVACGLSCNNSSARALIKAMLLYNILVVFILTYAFLGFGFFTPLLALAVVLHVVLAICCIACL